jgi:Ca-activated chloride channel family protein
MQGFTFLHPWFFLLLIPLLVLVWFVYVKNSHVQPFSGFSDLIKVYQSNSVYIKLYYILIFCILFFFVAIFSNFVSQVEKEKETKEGVDINIVLDVSYSMLAEDMKPSRLEVSKKII